ncbi:NADPH-dependent FMN reductase [Yinghuangia seranimata]|uniref:NADPH-dependent FMN reductase n=1 Tax=Yinghuangia seranimata TaxID=408067 RepID=UPI00248AE8CF|nr:NADPH-dependent FMN reductase [Yinghuangia seranimata]MDI2132025.1 NADPH-dependent FMN reductase [Yinghuangia seranimata]
MSSILTLWGTPSAVSRTGIVAEHVATRLAAAGHRVDRLAVRDLPATALLHADTSDPVLRDALRLVEKADALVVASPVYKASYSGVLKTFLDVLPQFALRGKSVLPVLTGGTPAHVLALDYALRPVLTSLGATHVAQGWFVHESFVHPAATPGPDPDPHTGAPAEPADPADRVHRVDPDGVAPLLELVDAFSARLFAEGEAR